MSAATRRTIVAGIAGLPTFHAIASPSPSRGERIEPRPLPQPCGVAGLAAADGHPDAELLRACAEHMVNLRAVLASPGCTDAPGGHPAWEAYQRTHDAINAAEPATMAGVLAKARVAMSEGVSDNLFEGEHAHGFGFTAHAWAWEVLQDLVRIQGIAIEDPHTGAALRWPLDGEAGA
jgi:hypothetical protein